MGTNLNLVPLCVLTVLLLITQTNSCLKNDSKNNVEISRILAELSSVFAFLTSDKFPKFHLLIKRL